MPQPPQVGPAEWGGLATPEGPRRPCSIAASARFRASFFDPNLSTTEPVRPANPDESAELPANTNRVKHLAVFTGEFSQPRRIARGRRRRLAHCKDDLQLKVVHQPKALGQDEFP